MNPVREPSREPGILDQALQDAGIARDETFVTNAVKHFKYEMRGKQKPLALADGTALFITVHPSALLRIRDKSDKRAAYKALVADLKRATQNKNR
jgi:uracil-DNA glycosylase